MSLNKIYLIFFLVFLQVNFYPNIYSQKIGFSYGVSATSLQADNYVNVSGEKGSFYINGLSVWGRKVIANSNISVGVPISLLISFSAVNKEGKKGAVGINLPTTAEYNFGLGAEPMGVESKSKFGGFIGGGFNYTYTTASSTFFAVNNINFGTPIKGITYGPMVHIGLRAMLSGIPYTLRFFYSSGLEKAKLKMLGVSLFYNL